MRKILGVLILLSFSLPAYSLRKTDFEHELALMIEVIQKEFLKGKTFTVFDTYTVVPIVKIIRLSSLRPNAELVNTDEKHMGIGINRALLRIKDPLAIWFALAHEFGHAFSANLLEDIGCAGISGTGTEVIADLGAMWVLKQRGNSFEKIERSVLNWEKSDIFDKTQSGDHPEGAKRAEYIVEAIRQIKNGSSFQTAVNDIIRNHVKSDCPNKAIL